MAAQGAPPLDGVVGVRRLVALSCVPSDSAGDQGDYRRAVREMSKAFRCKFVCESVTTRADSWDATFRAVTSGSAENEAIAAAEKVLG